MDRFVQVVPLLGVRTLGRRSFDYLVPSELEEEVVRGRLVRIPFNRRVIRGIVVGTGTSGDVSTRKIRELKDVLPYHLGVSLLGIAERMSSYYHAPLGACLLQVAPPVGSGRGHGVGRLVTWVGERSGKDGVAKPSREGESSSLTPKQEHALSLLHSPGEPLVHLCSRAGVGRGVVQALVEKGLLVSWKAPLPRAPMPRDDSAGLEESGGADATVASAPELEHRLTAEQMAAFETLDSALNSREPKREVLWGVTGSGKTELYLRLAEEVLAHGGSAIVLVPEIGLSVQAEIRFRRRFGENVGILHSGLPPGERLREYRRVLSGEARVVVGARSAVFAPVENLKLVVVDEAHDTSYKQAEEPHYDARTVAWWRIQEAGGLLLEGSATPPVGSMLWEGEPIRLRERASGANLPEVELVDMRSQGGKKSLSPRSRGALQATLRRGEQAVVLLNRRGYSSFLQCTECGGVPACDHCEIALTYHRSAGVLRCHHCGYQNRAPGICPTCGSGSLSRGAPGTQRVEEELAELVPEGALFRLDSDVTTSGGRVTRILEGFSRARPGVLLGTQMVAKGHDYPDVTLVLVADADTGLYAADFRSAERTFQLLTQVVGRSGRGERAGKALVQTWNPDAHCIRMALARDDEGFLADELAQRERLGFPPFRNFTRVIVSSKDEEKAKAAGNYLLERLKPYLSSDELLGPVRLLRLRGRSRWQLVLAAEDGERVPLIVDKMVEELRGPFARRRVDLLVDVDPEWLD